MKGIDVFVVRMLPFILYIILGINILCCWLGIEEITVTYNLHGNSALYALGLYLISLANPKYHCVWNRAMYVYLIIVPCLNFADAIFDFMPMGKAYLSITWALYLATALATAYLAIRHFVLITKHRIDNELHPKQQQPNNKRNVRHKTLQGDNPRRTKRKSVVKKRLIVLS